MTKKVSVAASCAGMDSELRQTRARVQAYYAHTMDDYSEFWSGPADSALHLGHLDADIQGHSASLVRTNEYLAAQVTLAPGCDVLDAGCGIGGSSVWLTQTYGCRVTALNIVMEHLLQAKLDVRRLGLTSSVHPVCVDFHQIAMRDESFDVVWALESGVHSCSRLVMYGEFSRVLRGYGHLVLADIMIAERAQMNRSGALALDALTSGWALSSLTTESRMLTQLRAAGFKPIDVHDTSSLVAPSVARLGDLARTAALRTDEEVASGAWTQIRVGNIRACIALDELFREGTLRYVIMSAKKVRGQREAAV
ncbi:MAG TPA: methyltransferase domain-containing protein [Thermoanaerobaculia bacterium]|nr:methyltransferase domain-containing protein [Thermoanaerobaculia bacterium]